MSVTGAKVKMEQLSESWRFIIEQVEYLLAGVVALFGFLYRQLVSGYKKELTLILDEIKGNKKQVKLTLGILDAILDHLVLSEKSRHNGSYERLLKEVRDLKNK